MNKYCKKLRKEIFVKDAENKEKKKLLFALFLTVYECESIKNYNEMNEGIFSS